jgi:hypothetical protein
MTESRYVHAPDDAPLYRIPKGMGAGVFPAYRAWEQHVVLDIHGLLVQFFESDVIAIARPEGLPVWAVAVLVKVLEWEEHHGKGDECFAGALENVPADAMEFLVAEKDRLAADA